MKIEVFGAGCAKCKMLEDHVRRAIEQSGVKAEFIIIKDIEEIVKRGVLFPPALYIDGKEACAGRVPSVSDIVKLFEIRRKKRKNHE